MKNHPEAIDEILAKQYPATVSQNDSTRIANPLLLLAAARQVFRLLLLVFFTLMENTNAPTRTA